MSNSQRPLGPQAQSAFLQIARDLTASLATEDRYERLLSAVRQLLPADAACLLRRDGDDLVPLATHGLAPEAGVRRYPLSEHPRLRLILEAGEPVNFPPDSPLPDPFDGLVAGDPHALDHIHACLGCPLTAGGEVVGALTVDALTPGAFDGVDPRLLEGLGALAGAAVRTSELIERLEATAERRGQIAREMQRTGRGQLVGRSPAARKLLEDIDLVAGSGLPVLITGETGTGKELVAHQLHERSPRADEALVQVNCAALPESIAESELFGHLAGAFTGATGDRAGKFEMAHGSTLFLDEVGELPLSLQPKLLRALQQGEVQRVGSDRVHRVDVRVVAATNRDLEAEVRAGRFRADLFHRLAVYPLPVPPLRERREDIPLLAAHFLDASRRRLGLGPVRLADRARELLRAADWPGNVRELENVLNRAVLRAAATTPPGRAVLVEPQHLDVRGARAVARAPRPEPAEPAPAGDDRSLRERTDDYQRAAILAAVREEGGNWAAAARRLGMHRGNLHRLAGRLGLRDDEGD